MVSGSRNHHSYWLDLYENIEWFEQKTGRFLAEFNQEIVTEAYQIAAQGFPANYQFREYKILFTCGIGQSFGYPNENGMHFDIMQLFREYENKNFKEIIAHEIHHLIYMDNVKQQENNLEGYFLQCFAPEGLAIKFTNNAEGRLSKKIHTDEPENSGLDKESMEYLNAHFDSTYAEFKKTISDIRSGKINTIEEINELIRTYWFNCYTEEQNENEIPRLKQSRIYAMGNELWGTIYDIYGIDKLYEILNNPETAVAKFNEALAVSGREKYVIE